jgi:hypothetical protein
MPTLNNLTVRQKQLADLIWNCDSTEDVQLLIRSLPTEYRKDAATVLAMIRVRPRRGRIYLSARRRHP